MALLKADLRIGKDVLYAVVEEIENDKGFAHTSIFLLIDTLTIPILSLSVHY